jgi:hypothetical protein
MPFGRYRGWSLDELPDDYLEWLDGLDDLREPLRSAVAREQRPTSAAACAADFELVKIFPCWRILPPSALVIVARLAANIARFEPPPVTALVTLPADAVPVAHELVTLGYRALTRRHHPDAGGDHRTMVLVNTAVAWLRDAVRSAA